MSRFNEGGMHFVSYHRRDKEFDEDTKYASKKHNQPKQQEHKKEIISYKGKMYQVVKEDEDGNKTVIPYNPRNKRKKRK